MGEKKPADVRPIHQDADGSWITDGGWASEVSGVGHADRDPSRSFVPTHTGPLDDDTLEALYHEDPLMARFCDLRPEEMLRRGFRLNVEADDEDEGEGAGEEGDVDRSTEIATDVQTWADEIHLVPACIEAMVWANVFGGSAIFVGAIDGLPLDLPLNETGIRSIRFLTVLDRRYLAVERYQDDPLAPGYGEPSLYRFIPREGYAPQQRQIFIHASRLVRFEGVRTSRYLRRQNLGWGFSLLQRVFRVYQLYAGAWFAVGHRLQNWSIPVWGMVGLKAILSGPNKAELAARMEIMSRYMSVVRAALIEKDKESFEFQTASFDGVKDILQEFSVQICAAGRAPRTLVFGSDVAGFAAGTDPGTRGFYDSVERERERDLKPQLERLLHLGFMAQDGPTGGAEPETWDVSFPPLWSPDPKQEAEIRKIIAETDAILIDKGEATPEECALSHYRPEGYSPEIQIDRSIRVEPTEVVTPAEKAARAAAEAAEAAAKLASKTGQKPPEDDEEKQPPEE